MGQNARLAARLTGYKIDIKSYSAAQTEEELVETPDEDAQLPDEEAALPDEAGVEAPEAED